MEKRLKEQGLYDRVIFGMHDALDPSRVKILQLAKENKNQIKELRIKFNYPKSQFAPGDWRIFNKEVGGTLLDLGVYNLRLAHDIA